MKEYISPTIESLGGSPDEAPLAITLALIFYAAVVAVAAVHVAVAGGAWVYAAAIAVSEVEVG